MLSNRFLRYRWKQWEYRGKANNLGIVPKDSIGKDQDIVLKDWQRETFDPKHDRTRLWLTVGGAVIGALFSMLVIGKRVVSLTEGF